MTESTARVERVNLQSVSSPAYNWEPENKPVSVRMPFPLIDRMEREVVENFRSLTSRGSEIGGILLGSSKPGSPATVFIDDYEAIPCDYSRGPLYRLSDADMGRFERAIEQHMTDGGPKVIGFFRSHTRKGLSLDAEDLSFFAARFRDPSNVALLVRPFATKASTAGFFIWENGSVQGESSYLEFPFRSSQLSSSRQNTPAVDPPLPPNPAVGSAAAAPPAPATLKPVVRAQIVPIASRREITLPVAPEPVESKPAVTNTPAAAAPPAPAAAAPAPAKEKEKEAPKEKAAAAPPVAPAKPKESKPKEAEREKPRERAAAVAPVVEKTAVPPAADEVKQSGSRAKTATIAALAATVLLVCTVLFLYPGVLRHGSKAGSGSAEAPSLSLRVERTGTDILLTWNRDSAAIQRATHAVLTISDGERHENYDMDLSQLRNGSIVYSPLTADVSFRMEVTGAGNIKSANESVRVLRTRPSPMPDGAESPVEAAKATPKPVIPANPSTPATAAPDPSAEEPASPASTRSSVPSKPFNTESLAQRLRPATPTEAALPDAPTLNSNVAAPAAIPNIGGTSVAPAPFVAAPAPPPAASERRSAAAAPQTPVNSGGQITQAQVIYSKQPDYPKLARQLGVKGTVEVIATIGADGHVKAVKVEHGHPLLTKAATDAVMQWVYRPTLLNGVAVQNDTHITLNFLGEK